MKFFYIAIPYNFKVFGMDQVPSTVNNSNINFIDLRLNAIKIVYNIIKKERDETFFAEELLEDNHNDYYEEDVIENMMGSAHLTKQATDVISSIEGDIIFVHEKVSYGDIDEDGPTETFWSLYVMVVKDFVVTKLKFYREVYVLDEDNDEDIAYEPEELNKSDNKFFEATCQQLYPSENKNIVHNTDPSELTKSAQKIITSIKEENLGNVFFTAEERSYGDTDDDGPLEYFWDLYVFIQKEDNTIIRRKFFREFHWKHDNCDMDDVPYEECALTQKDEKKTYHL